MSSPSDHRRLAEDGRAEPSRSLGRQGEICSAQLLRGRKEVLIQHGADLYRLRLTRTNKLILTK
jgi:hemin uptake protein HemP